jgi:hypothetical protein
MLAVGARGAARIRQKAVIGGRREAMRGCGASYSWGTDLLVPAAAAYLRRFPPFLLGGACCGAHSTSLWGLGSPGEILSFGYTGGRWRRLCRDLLGGVVMEG